jgi:hypothetical protein
MHRRTKKTVKSGDVDDLIRAARRAYQAAEDRATALIELRICNRLQRFRFRLFGSFLPHEDGTFWLFDTVMERWSSWQSVTMPPC